MIEKIKSWVSNNKNIIAILLALVGFVFYLTHSWGYAHSLVSSNWDEGMYLYKGVMFVTGEQRPFADYGLWTNQLPVAYLIPGFFQMVFGRGIETGRVYAFVLGALTVVGMWLAARRQGNYWWAAGMVWVIALNTGWIKSYSLALSQVLVSFFFAWMMVFSLGKSRRTWELALASFLAALAGLTRLNVLPVVFLFILYVFWQYDARKGWVVAAAGLLPILLTHLQYWPDILKVWAYWLPEDIFPMIAAYRSPHQMVFVPSDFSWWDIRSWVHSPDYLVWVGIDSLVEALRANFSVVVSVVGTVLLWPKKLGWKSEQQQKTAVFLLVTFVAMFIVHAWAALGGHSCQFSCFSGYMLFFNVFGLMLFVTTASALRVQLPAWRKALVFALVLISITVLVLNFNSDYKSFRSFLVYDVFNAEVGRMQSQEARQQPETQPFWRFVEERFEFTRYRYLRIILFTEYFETLLRWGIILFFSILLPVGIRLLMRKLDILKVDFGRYLVFFMLGFAVLWGGTSLMKESLDYKTCGVNVIDHYKVVGQVVADEIEPGAKVFWLLKSNILLLDLPDREFSLPQTNWVYTYIPNSTSTDDELLRFSWWNHSIGESWIAEADYIVMQNREYTNNYLWDWQQRVEEGKWNIALVTQPLDYCTGAFNEVVILKSNQQP